MSAPLRRSIFDPTGNITALVEGEVEPEAQPHVAAALMRRHPEVEQVGFVRFGSGEPGVQAELRMAGGEFCGNASMSAAALWLLRQDSRVGEPATVRLRVSGTERPVELRLRREGPDCFSARVHMPQALSVAERSFAFEGRVGRLALVRLEGIAHSIIGEGSPFFVLRDDRAAAERAVRAWCEELSAPCLGLMFLDGSGEDMRLRPLVYVPGSGTVFWESSCASGSAAVAMALARQRGGPVSLTLREPGGSLRVKCDPAAGETWLMGTTRLIGTVDETVDE